MMRFLGITLVVMMTQATLAANFTPMKQTPAAIVSGDTEVFKFILGEWKLTDGSCLSGTPVFWGGNPADFEFTVQFNADLSYTHTSLNKGQLSSESTGSFAVSQGLLSFHQVESCSYQPNQKTCMGGGNNNWAAMASIQGSQLWLLMSVGGEPGACPAHDVFTLKFDRK